LAAINGCIRGAGRSSIEVSIKEVFKLAKSILGDKSFSLQIQALKVRHI
jgi:hypothetical protein